MRAAALSNPPLQPRAGMMFMLIMMMLFPLPFKITRKSILLAILLLTLKPEEQHWIVRQLIPMARLPNKKLLKDSVITAATFCRALTTLVRVADRTFPLIIIHLLPRMKLTLKQQQQPSSNRCLIKGECQIYWKLNVSLKLPQVQKRRSSISHGLARI